MAAFLLPLAMSLGAGMLGSAAGSALGDTLERMFTGEYDPQDAMAEVGDKRQQLIQELLSQGVPFSKAQESVDASIDEYIAQKKSEYDSQVGKTGQMIGGLAGGLLGGGVGSIAGSSAMAPARAALGRAAGEAGKKAMGGVMGVAKRVSQKAAEKLTPKNIRPTTAPTDYAPGYTGPKAPLPSGVPGGYMDELTPSAPTDYLAQLQRGVKTDPMMQRIVSSIGPQNERLSGVIPRPGDGFAWGAGGPPIARGVTTAQPFAMRMQMPSQEEIIRQRLLQITQGMGY